jgi:hypothetical protein
MTPKRRQQQRKEANGGLATLSRSTLILAVLLTDVVMTFAIG